MDEKYFKDKISGYFDGDLKPEEMEMMREWLENSEEGRRALEEIGRLDEFVRLNSDLSGGDDFWEAQARKIEAKLGFENDQPANVESIAKPKAKGMAWKWVAAAASIVLLAYIGINEMDIVTGPDDITTRQESPQVGNEKEAMTPDSEESRITKDEAAGEPEAAAEDLSGDISNGDKAEKKVATRTEPDVAVEQNSRASKPATVDVEVDNRQRLRSDGGGVTDRPKSVQPSAAAPAPPSEEMAEQTPSVRRAKPSGQMLDQDITASIDEAVDAMPIDSMLPVWRKTYAETDSILTSLASTKTDSRLEDIGKTTSGFAESSRSAQGASASEREKVEQRLLEACYNVARLTPDSTEADSMRSRLEQFAADTKSPHRSTAQGYLDQLSGRR